jgi:hypothetical protein
MSGRRGASLVRVRQVDVFLGLASLLLLFCAAMVFVRLRRKELAGTGA